MYENDFLDPFFEVNTAFPVLFVICVLVSLAGLARGDIKPCLIVTVLFVWIMSTASVFLHGYCWLVGIEAQTIDDYDTSIICAILFVSSFMLLGYAYIKKKFGTKVHSDM